MAFSGHLGLQNLLSLFWCFVEWKCICFTFPSFSLNPNYAFVTIFGFCESFTLLLGNFSSCFLIRVCGFSIVNWMDRALSKTKIFLKFYVLDFLSFTSVD